MYPSSYIWIYLEGPVENESLEDKENILKYFDIILTAVFLLNRSVHVVDVVSILEKKWWHVVVRF